MDKEDAMNVNINLNEIRKTLDRIAEELKRYNDNRL